MDSWEHRELELLGIDTLPDGRHLVTCSTMQGLCVDNNQRKETMNSYLLNTADGDAVQSPEA